MSQEKTIKGSCLHCEGHLAFPREMTGQEIECPHCGGQTTLKAEPALETNDAKEESASAALKSGMAGLAKAATITARKAAEAVSGLQDSEKVKDLRDKAGKAASDLKDKAGKAASDLKDKAEKASEGIKADPGKFRKRLILAGSIVGVLLVAWLGFYQPWKTPFERDLHRAEKGHAKSQFRVGARYDFGKDVEKDLDKAIEWYRKAAEQDYVDALFNLGEIAINKEGNHYNPREAKGYFERAAELGDKEAFSRLGALHFWGQGTKIDYSKALECFMESKEFPDSQWYLGKHYDKGHGVEQDIDEAVKWWRKAAAQDHAPSLYYLATCYAEGDGVKQDEEEALKYFQKSADLGYRDGLAAVGIYLTWGDDPPDPKKGFEAGMKAHELGSHEGTYVIGYCYYDGKGVKQNQSKGMALIQEAARKGNQDARLALQRFQQQQRMNLMGAVFNFFADPDGGMDGDEQAARSREQMNQVAEQQRIDRMWQRNMKR